MAAGLSVEQTRSKPRWTRLGELLAKQGADKIGPADLRLDGILMPAAATVELVKQIEQAGPLAPAPPRRALSFPMCRSCLPNASAQTT